MKSLNWRFLFIVALTGWASYVASPTFIYFAQPNDVKQDMEKVASKIPSWLPKGFVNLGLDLQGGVQLVLGVNTDEAVQTKLSRMGTEIARWGKDNTKGINSAYYSKDSQTLRMKLDPALFADSGKLGTLRAEIAKEFPGLELRNKEDNTLDYSFEAEQFKSIKEAALEQAERVVRNRVDKGGFTQPLVARRADKTVLVQLPGFSDPEKAKSLLGKTAQLSFKIEDDAFTAFGKLEGKLPEGVSLIPRSSERGNTYYALSGQNKQQIAELAASLVPEDRELLFERELIAGGTKSRFYTHVVFAATELTGDDILNATVGQSGSRADQFPATTLRFTGTGAKRFADVTGANIGRAMAIVLDNEVVSAPNINSRIGGGRAEISMGGSNYQEALEEAQELSLVLKSGALPATIEVLEERQVGASLGPKLATQGVQATLCGLILVLLFMLFYYRRPGLIACIALSLNGLFLIALMSSLGYALSLPGIAGFILTLGMAVDANVLINERIRQELRDGRNARNAVENGFAKVFWTIIDANLTTLIAALVLLETNSSGPIRGFATTLMLGIMVSMFTSLYCSKVFFNVALKNKQSDKAIRTWLGGGAKKSWNIDFLRMSTPVVVLSLVLACSVIGFFATKGSLNWAVDFAGGTEMELSFKEDVDSTQLQALATKAGVKSLEVQQLENSSKKYVLRFDRQSEEGTARTDENARKMQQLVMNDLKAQSPTVEKMDFVGPKVGRDLRAQGFKSALFAVLMVLAYIFLRFDLRFGPGAVIKMVLDVFVMLAFYAFAWRPFDLTSVAALLTVIGYSVNDTIVIYDRIRENLGIFPKRSFYENINNAVNETFTRTLNTSITTVFALLGILVFGTAQIWNFAAAMAIGVIAATISSLFIATKLLIWFDVWRNRKAKA